VASLAVLIAAADTYVVVLALPDMMTGVGLGLDELQRAAPIVTAFLLGYVSAQPLIGRLADLRGCRAVLVGCLLIFAVGCLFTASATGLATLVAGRALQGIGGGGLVPATLALVAASWPAARRGLPLGVVGAVQEVGSALGPVAGAAVLAVSDWRWIFWLNLVAAVMLSLVLQGGLRARDPMFVATALAAIAATALVLMPPQVLLEDVRWGLAWVPILPDAAWSTPLVLAAIGFALLAGSRYLPRAGVRRLAHEVDAAGATLLAIALAGVVLAFATADPQIAAISSDAPLWLALTAVALVGFVWRQRVAQHPLVPGHALRQRAAWGSLLTNVPIGAALVAVLVDVPIFARTTTQVDSQLGAALVLVQLLVALPIAALAGGWLVRRVSPRVVAGSGMACAATGLALMTRWGPTSLSGPGATATLVLTGAGFGLSVSPVNSALLAATRQSVHGVTAALVVVCRMIGMLVGLSVLTAVGLRQYYSSVARIPPSGQLCPATPDRCPAYLDATRAALIGELHTIFAGAAVAAAVAAVLAFTLLRGPAHEGREDRPAATGRIRTPWPTSRRPGSSAVRSWPSPQPSPQPRQD
jgi:MFS family permease